jgi:hypothetical protein
MRCPPLPCGSGQRSATGSLPARQVIASGRLVPPCGRGRRGPALALIRAGTVNPWTGPRPSAGQRLQPAPPRSHPARRAAAGPERSPPRTRQHRARSSPGCAVESAFGGRTFRPALPRRKHRRPRAPSTSFGADWTSPLSRTPPMSGGGPHGRFRSTRSVDVVGGSHRSSSVTRSSSCARRAA